MKYVLISLICLAIILIALHEIKYQRQKTLSLDQVVRLISFIKNDLHYRKSDCKALFEGAREQGLECITLFEGSLHSVGCFDDAVDAELRLFLKSIGTTDTEGQLKLCDEYYQRMQCHLEEQRMAEKSKTQVNFAVSLLGAFCIVVLFV